MKPHIRWSCIWQRWVCLGAECSPIGEGHTPAQAYQDWEYNNAR